MGGRKALDPANYGGFVLAFEPARTESIAEILDTYGEASESFSAEDWGFERCELVLLVRRRPKVAVFAAALMRRMGGSGGTRRVKMRITEPILFEPPVEGDDEQNAETLQSAVSTAESLKRIDPATWKQLLNWLKARRPHLASEVDSLIQQRIDDRRLIGHGDRIARLAEERDAIGLALDIGGLDRKQIFRTATSSMVGSARSALDLLDCQPVAERSLIEHDARVFRTLLAGFQDSAQFGDEHGRRVRTYVTDQTPIETAAGVDLLVYQEQYDSFLMLQYKGMERDVGVKGWSYRVDGSNLDDQLSAMRAVRGGAPKAPEALQLRDQRLFDEPFYFKFCERTRASAREESLVAGITMSAPHLEHFLSLPEATAQKHGRHVGYENCPRYLNNTEFISLARSGWIGCLSPTTDFVNGILASRAEGRAAVYAFVTGKSELRAIDRGRRY